MLEFMRFFRSFRNFRYGSFDYEECGVKPDGRRVFLITGIEKRTGHRGKVCEFTCAANDKMCKYRVMKLIKSFEKRLK